MTAPNKRPSAYPASLDDLMSAARDLADRLGELPSRNRLMAELHIGAKKATALREELRTLHLVPGSGQDDPADAPDGTGRPEPGTAPEPDPADATEPAEVSPAGTAETAPADDQADAEDSAPVAPAANPGTAPEPAALTPADDDGQDDGGQAVDTEGQADEQNPAPAPVRARKARKQVPVWPVLALTFPAFAAVWSGWVSLGAMAGFGVVHPLPGIADHVTLNTAITLPIGVEVYAAYALWVWLSSGTPTRARTFARLSAISSLTVGALGQVCYHLLAAQHVTHAPAFIVTAVACLPVAVLGMGAALAHLVRDHD